MGDNHNEVLSKMTDARQLRLSSRLGAEVLLGRHEEIAILGVVQDAVLNRGGVIDHGEGHWFRGRRPRHVLVLLCD